MSGGVVFVPGIAGLGRYGNPVNIASGAVIPIGLWYIDVAWTLTTHDNTTHVQPVGYCNSDGTTAVANAVGHLIPIGV